MSSDTPSLPPEPNVPAQQASSPDPAAQAAPEPAAPVTPDAGAEQPLFPAPPAAAPAPERTPEERAARRRRRQLGAAALLAVVTGVAAAVLVTLPERTDIPGLATPNDGRYEFPELALPPLPAGASPPNEYKMRTHAADLRGLLLPLPKGAVATAPSASVSASGSASVSASPSASPSASVSPSGSGAASPSPGLPSVPGRWIPCDRDAMLAKDDAYALRLTTDACRGAAAQGWTAADGTRTELRLFRFGSKDEAADFFARAYQQTSTKDIGATHLDAESKYPVALGETDIRVSDEQVAGLATGRIGWLQSGDVVALVQLTNPKGVPTQAFRQVFALQSGMLY